MAYLVSMDGPDQDTRFELATKGEMMLGRRTDNAIIIEGPAVSGHHCTLSIADGIYVVRDAGSTNGTRLNDEPVAEATMFRNDILTLGTTPLRLEGADVPERDDDPSDVGGVDRTLLMSHQKMFYVGLYQPVVDIDYSSARVAKNGIYPFLF